MTVQPELKINYQKRPDGHLSVFAFRPDVEMHLSIMPNIDIETGGFINWIVKLSGDLNDMPGEPDYKNNLNSSSVPGYDGSDDEFYEIADQYLKRFSMKKVPVREFFQDLVEGSINNMRGFVESRRTS